MATTLTPEQRKLAQQLVTIGQQVGASPKEIKAALETAAVEKNFTNTGGGDADSSNWRQERASVYGGQWAKTGGALNLEASAKRFYDEARQFNRTGQYGSAGQLAAAVQRPAAQYRGRYQQQSGLAQSLLGGAFPAAGSGTTSVAAPASSGSGPAAAPLLGDPGQSADFTGLLGQMLARPQQQAPQVQAVAPPQFSARPALPQGFQAPAAQAQQQAQTSSGVEGALSLLGSLRGVDPASAAPSPAGAGSGRQDTVVGTVTKQRDLQKDAAKGGTALKGSKVLELIYNDGGAGFGIKNGAVVKGSQVFSGVWAGHANHVHVAAGPKTIVALGEYAQQLGLHVGENSHFGGVDAAAHVPGSYHVKDEAIDVSAPLTAEGKALMKKYAVAVDQYNRTGRLPAVS